MCATCLLVDATIGAGTQNQMEKKLLSKKELSRIYFTLRSANEVEAIWDKICKFKKVIIKGLI